MLPGVVAHVAPEGGDARGEIREPVGELAVHAALVLVRVPAGHVSKRGFNAEVRFEQLRNLPHAVAELGVGIIRARGGRVLRGVRGAQHLHGFKGFVACGMENAVAGIGIHGFKRAGSRRRRWPAPGDGESR